MVIQELVIENFKGIAHCVLQFQPGFNLLIGNNGAGKTSILEAASVALGGYIAGIDDVATRNFNQDEIRRSSRSTGDGSYTHQYETPVKVTCKARLHGASMQWTRRKSSVKASRSTVEPRDICKIAARAARDPESVLPVLSYQSAARTWMQKREANENIFGSQFDRTVGYRHCLEDASDPKSLVNWCAHMEHVSWQLEKPIGEYEAVKRALTTFMSVMNDGVVAQVRYEKRTGELSYLENGVYLPIRLLSAGYQSIIWMVLDIAYRMALLNPDLREEAAQSPGVVLIDEMDMHLHPKWQWNIIGALQKTFPNVQFIAATHSPILIAACKDGNLIFVEQDGAFSRGTDFGMEVNDVLTYTQGSSAMLPDVRAMLDHIYQLIDSEALECADRELDQAQALLGAQHPEVQKARMALEFERAVGEAEE